MPLSLLPPVGTATPWLPLICLLAYYPHACSPPPCILIATAPPSVTPTMALYCVSLTHASVKAFTAEPYPHASSGESPMGAPLPSHHAVHRCHASLLPPLPRASLPIWRLTVHLSHRRESYHREAVSACGTGKRPMTAPLPSHHAAHHDFHHFVSG